MDVAGATIHRDIICSGLTTASANVANIASVDTLNANATNTPLPGTAAHFQVAARRASSLANWAQ